MNFILEYEIKFRIPLYGIFSENLKASFYTVVTMTCLSIQVYTPKDPSYTWLVAKMFYNNAEAQHHQALTHLGYTHLLMEGVVICTHRNLSPSHPLFKLMAPHFLFLLAINT